MSRVPGPFDLSVYLSVWLSIISLPYWIKSRDKYVAQTNFQWLFFLGLWKFLCIFSIDFWILSTPSNFLSLILTFQLTSHSNARRVLSEPGWGCQICSLVRLRLSYRSTGILALGIAPLVQSRRHLGNKYIMQPKCYASWMINGALSVSTANRVIKNVTHAALSLRTITSEILMKSNKEQRAIPYMEY